MARPTRPRWALIMWGMTLWENSGVRMISSTISSTTGTVRCPMSEARPRPTMRPIAASSSIHRPVSIISLSGGERNLVE